MILEKAQKIAIEKVELLRPHCHRIEIAGSIRRKKAEVKDIEIVCLPKTFELQNNLFGVKAEIRIQEFVDTVRMWEQRLGDTYGKYTKRMLPEGIMLDLFMPTPVDYYRQLAIRTGSAEYSQRVIAWGWRKKGWCGSDLGLRLMSDCVEKKDKEGKSKWVCTNPNAELPPVWASEREFFEWLGLGYLEPEQRI